MENRINNRAPDEDKCNEEYMVGLARFVRIVFYTTIGIGVAILLSNIEINQLWK